MQVYARMTDTFRLELVTLGSCPGVSYGSTPTILPKIIWRCQTGNRKAKKCTCNVTGDATLQKMLWKKKILESMRQMFFSSIGHLVCGWAQQIHCTKKLHLISTRQHDKAFVAAIWWLFNNGNFWQTADDVQRPTRPFDAIQAVIAQIQKYKCITQIQRPARPFHAIQAVIAHIKTSQELRMLSSVTIFIVR